MVRESWLVSRKIAEPEPASGGNWAFVANQPRLTTHDFTLHDSRSTRHALRSLIPINPHVVRLAAYGDKVDLAIAV